MVDKRFRAQLVQQLKFIENSCTAYDHGEQAEAIRIGTSLRMLLHDTPRSTSLLTHLEAKKTPLLSTCSQKTEIPDSTFFDELTAFTMNSSGIVIRPQLGDSGPSIELPADDWWQQLVIGLGNGIKLSRAVIAVTAANKDGGAHVDEDLPEAYGSLVLGVWQSVSNQGALVIPHHHFIHLRQMGYEILNSPQLLALTG